MEGGMSAVERGVQRWDRAAEVDAALARVFGEGVRPLRLEEALFDAILAGWRAQQAARHLAESTKRDREAVVRRFRVEVERWPWEWRALDVDEWLEDLGGPPRRLAVSTLRGFQGALRAFVEYLTDERYPWAAICEREFGRRPVQVIDERNRIAHVSDFEGRPGRRPLSREELMAFFAFCDAQVHRRRALGRKGALAAFRDAALFKSIYAFGLRRQEAARLDVTDFGRNPHRASFGRYGTLSVRYGKASRGSAPKRRNVLTVFDWSVEVLEQYVEQVRPLYGRDEHPALWLTERGARIESAKISRRFAELRDALGLAGELTVHSLRHSYVTHLIEDGFDELFVRMQVGHRFASTTALYTGVSGAYKNDAMRAALRTQLDGTLRLGSEGGR
ncbi:MAG TPA: tyrosine-type recombinase/integrase [Solirubrobacter sp.]|nr:tyrosine-type recombinase/integrase [Solirubrobacter sp.]